MTATNMCSNFGGFRCSHPLIGLGVQLPRDEKFLAILKLFLCYSGGQGLKSPKFEHIFVAVITFFLFLLCRYF